VNINRDTSVGTTGRVFTSDVFKTGLAVALLMSIPAASLHAEGQNDQTKPTQHKVQNAAPKAGVKKQKAAARKVRKHIQALAGQSIPPARPAFPEYPSPQLAADVVRHMIDVTDDKSLTWNGVTIYGNIDTGVSYQTHGAPLSDTLGQGLEYGISKPNYHTLLSVAPNALSRSAAGIKGDVPIIQDWHAVFKLETQFVPTSLQLMNSPATLVKNNGLWVANGLESSNGDAVRAGQIFTYAYGGVSSATFGTLTFGRQNSLGIDQVLDYDPIPGAPYGFSALGFSSTLGSGFDITEDSILDESLKYRVSAGPLRAAVAYKFDDQRNNANGSAVEGEIGVDYAGFSLDGIVGKANNAITATSLSCAENAKVNNVTPVAAGCPSGLRTADNSNYLTGMGGANVGNGLVDATVSDNLTFTLAAKYQYGPFQFFGGYENIRFSNPANPLQLGNGLYAEGGYGIYSLNQNAYVTGKILQLFWTGARFAVRTDLDLAVGYYHQIQNSYITNSITSASLTPLCYNSSAHSNCSGTADSASFLAVYHWTKRLDVYAGAMLSIVNGGMASGYAAAGIASDGKTTISNSAGMIDPTIGLRYQF
jgi:predicted porin